MPDHLHRSSSKSSRISRMHPMVPDRSLEPQNVVYSSTNRSQNKAFEATSQPNSVHAAKLAELATLIQINRPPEAKPHYALLPWTPTTPQRRLQQVAYGVGRDTPPPARVTLVSNERCPPGGSRLAYQGTVVYQPQQQVQQTWNNGPPAYQQVYQQPSVQHEEIQHRQAQAMLPPEVTRYTTEERTAYNLKSRSGQLYVSAPAGSNEAQLFDEVARRNAKPKAHSEERRVIRKEHVSSKGAGKSWFKW